MRLDEVQQSEFSEISSFYFNTAYIGPIPKSSILQGEKALQIQQDPSFYPHSKWRNLPESLRKEVAQLLTSDQFTVHPKNIAISTSSSEIVSHIANGCPAKSKVCLLKGDYPSVVLPWLHSRESKDYKLQFLEESSFLDLNQLEKFIAPNTNILAISHVRFNTGTRFNLKELGQFCHDRNILLVVDATQSLGGLQLLGNEVQFCDVIHFSAYKWLLCPYGNAFAYFSDQALNKIKNTHSSWLNIKKYRETGASLLDYSTEPLAGATKFDRGQSPNIVSTYIAQKSLELINKIELKQIEIHNQKLLKSFTENLPHPFCTSPEPQSNIVCIPISDPKRIQEELQKKNVDVSLRENNLRISFHLFNTKNQVDFLTQTLRELIR